MSIFSTSKLKVDDIKSILTAPSHDICNTFVGLIDKVFGGDDTYWDLMCGVRGKEDGERVLALLSPNGELVQTMLAAMAAGRVQALVELPMERLSAWSRCAVDQGCADEFVRSRMAVRPAGSSGGGARTICLNVLEYFLFCLLDYPGMCRSRCPLGLSSLTPDIISTTADSLYCQLALRHMDFFLLRDVSSARLPLSPHKLIRHHQHHNHQEPFYLTATFVSLLLECWLNPFIPTPSPINRSESSSHTRGGPLNSSSFIMSRSRHNVSDSLQELGSQPPLPSLGQVCLTRLAVKHLYHFCCRPAATLLSPTGPASQMESQLATRLDNFRLHTVMPLVSERLSAYCSHLLHAWPADLSFKMVLETWLSGLQPWRYCDSPQFNPNSSSGPSTALLAGQYSGMLPGCLEMVDIVAARMLRSDLAVVRQAGMLSRLARVLASLPDHGLRERLVGAVSLRALASEAACTTVRLRQQLQGSSASSSQPSVWWLPRWPSWLVWSANSDAERWERARQHLQAALDNLGTLHPVLGSPPEASGSFLHQDQPQQQHQEISGASGRSRLTYYQRPACSYELACVIDRLQRLSVAFFLHTQTGRRLAKLCQSDKSDWSVLVARHLLLEDEKGCPRLPLRWLGNKRILLWTGVVTSGLYAHFLAGFGLTLSLVAALFVLLLLAAAILLLDPR